MNNMEIYNAFRAVPAEAQKTIGAGKLKGFTDINPMWRIKMLTEKFGMCGEGWYTSDVKTWIENQGNESAAFVTLNLYVKVGDGWSAPIFGIGGSKLSGKGVGDGINDEAYKMAYTDALSVACKALGMAADIYFSKDRTKYDIAPAPAPAQKPVAAEADEYYRLIVSVAEGKVSKKSGKDMRTAWIEAVNPSAEAIAQLDRDVAEYKKAMNINR